MNVSQNAKNIKKKKLIVSDKSVLGLMHLYLEKILSFRTPNNISKIKLNPFILPCSDAKTIQTMKTKIYSLNGGGHFSVADIAPADLLGGDVVGLEVGGSGHCGVQLKDKEIYQ